MHGQYFCNDISRNCNMLCKCVNKCGALQGLGDNIYFSLSSLSIPTPREALQSHTNSTITKHNMVILNSCKHSHTVVI